MADGLKTGICPKCNSTRIYTTEREIHKILPHDFKETISFSGRPSPVVDNFICANCGYTEFYVRPRYLGTVIELWDRYEPQANA